MSSSFALPSTLLHTSLLPCVPFTFDTSLPAFSIPPQSPLLPPPLPLPIVCEGGAESLIKVIVHQEEAARFFNEAEKKGKG